MVVVVSVDFSNVFLVLGLILATRTDEARDQVDSVNDYTDGSISVCQELNGHLKSHILC